MSRKRKRKAPALSSGEKEAAASGLVSRMRKLFESKASFVAPECGGVAEARADSPTIVRESSLPKPGVEGEASPSMKPEADAAETPLPEPSGESESPTSSEVAASPSENVKSSHRTLRKEKTGRVLIPCSYIKKLDIYCLFSSRTHIDVLTEALDSYFEAHSVPGVSLDAMLRKIRNSNR